MRITVIGPGGVGGYFGARLAQAGFDVRFIGRGAHLAAMKTNGLRVESSIGDIHLPDVQVSDDPAAFGPCDVILICVKLWATEETARAIKPLLGPKTAVISFQNGIDKEDLLRSVLGDAPVVGGICYIASAIKQPGVISHTGTLQRLLFGECDGRISDRTKAFLKVCQAGGIDAEISPDIRRSIWEKFVFLVGTSATTATMQTTLGRIRDDPRTRAFLLDLMKEVVAVGRAEGVPLDADFAENRLAFCEGLPAGMSTSMHKDLELGRRLEVDWLSGAVVKRGKAHGLATPLNRAVADILALRAQGRTGSGNFLDQP
jgi:2-dehydropantoate 2-reductase